MNIKTLRTVFLFVFFAVILMACQAVNDSPVTGSPTASVSNDSATVADQPPQLVSRIVVATAGAKNWQVVYQTDWLDLASIQCVENQTCYALTDGEAILRTTDAGQSWDKLAVAEMVVHSDSPFACAPTGFCLLIESINGGNVWVTRNGGTTWAKSGVSPVNSPESLDCPVLEKCILVTRQGEVFSTADGGKIWQKHLASNGITYKDITCLSESVCYVAGMVFAGEYGVVAKTVDGGLTWKEEGQSPVRGLRNISCPTPADCVSVGRFGVQITQDGGRVWRELSLGANGARSVGCASPQNCFIIDSQGQLLKWDGVSLTSQALAEIFSLRDVSCTPDDRCYAVGAFTLRNSNLPVSSDFGNNLNVSIGLVFLAGLVSFLSPCVLPVLPGYLAYLAARSSSQKIGQVSRWQILFHGLAFVAGFSIVFMTLGATASAIGQTLYAYKEWITRLGGVMIVFFGLQMAGLLRIPFLEFEIRKHVEPNPRLGYISSLLMGMFFSAGWTPCVGPTLGMVLTLAGTQASMTRGILLLALFSVGLGLPFIITALAVDRVGKWMRRMANLTRYVTLAAGVLLVGVGLLLILGQLNFLREFLPGLAIYL